jgi:hypothetical protein
VNIKNGFTLRNIEQGILAILVAAVYHFNNYDGRRRHFSNVRSGNS